MRSIGRVLLWLTGQGSEGDFAVLPHDRSCHVALGGVLLVPALLAVAGGCAAASFFRPSTLLQLAAGALWGAIVLAVDRALVISMRPSLPHPEGSGWVHRSWRALRSAGRLLALLATRATLAVLAGAVVSHMIVLALFRPEIDERLQSELGAKREAATTEPRAAILRLQERLQGDELELEALRERRRQLDYELYLEAAGQGASGRYDEGPAWRNLHRVYEELGGEIARRERKVDTRRQEARQEITGLEQQLARAATGIETAHATGYLARATALGAIVGNDDEARRHRSLFFLLVLALEMAPLVIKLMIIQGSPAAQLAALREHEELERVRIRLSALERVRGSRVEMEVERIMHEAVIERLGHDLSLDDLWAPVEASSEVNGTMGARPGRTRTEQNGSTPGDRAA